MALENLASKSSPYIYGLMFLAVISALLILYLNGRIAEGPIVSALLAMLGTFLGALLAFRLNERKDDAKNEKECKQELNLALFVVARQCNAIANMKENLKEFRTDFERAFNCPAIRPPEYTDISINFGALGFLLDANVPLLMRLSIAEEGFHQAMYSLKARNDFYINEVQTAIATSGLNRKETTVAEIKTSLGERRYEGAFNMARVMYKLVDQCAESLPLLQAELHVEAKRLYKNSKFVKLVEVERPAADDSINRPKSAA